MQTEVEAARRDAGRFAELFPHDEAHAGEVWLADGKPNFLWDLPHFRLNVGFYGNGQYFYYGEDKEGTHAERNVAAGRRPINTPLPDFVIDLLKR